jgi:hypothetical protein
MHFNLTGGTDDAISAFLVAIRPDVSVQILTDDQMDELISKEPESA